MTSVKHLTVRNLPADVAAALKKETRRRGASLNQTVIELLGQGLGVPLSRRRNGLAHLAGTWSGEEHAAFEQAIATVEEADEELWR